jgi:ankyrin repeat protein
MPWRKEEQHLFVAARHNYVDLIPLLLHHGANIHHETPTWGITALIVASKQNYVDVVRMLLEYDANINDCMMD